MLILNILNKDNSHLLSNVTLACLNIDYILVRTVNNQMVLIGKSQYPDVKYEWINEEASNNKFSFEIFNVSFLNYIIYAISLTSFFVECAEIIRDNKFTNKFKSGGLVPSLKGEAIIPIQENPLVIADLEQQLHKSILSKDNIIDLKLYNGSFK